jgi:hypothetical protein
MTSIVPLEKYHSVEHGVLHHVVYVHHATCTVNNHASVPVCIYSALY